MLTQNIHGWSSLAELVADVRRRHDGEVVKAEGTKTETGEVFAFTLSTCVWCNMGKEWLSEKGYGYSYLDVDKIPLAEKNQIKAELRMLTAAEPRFPFLVLVDKNKWHSGYDSSAWEALLGG